MPGRTSIAVLAALILAAPTALAEDYRVPPEDVVALVDAAPSPTVRLSPDGRWMLIVEGSSLPTIEDMSRRMLRLAGMRIDPATNARFTTRFDRRMALRPTSGGNARLLPMPAEARLASVSWSHDSAHFVYVVITDEGSELWGGSVAPGTTPRKLIGNLNGVFGYTQWMPDGATVLCRLVPGNRGDEPAPPTVPTGPNTEETTGERSPLRTYQDLLANPHDEALFDHYATTQPVLVSLRNVVIKTIGEPAIYRRLSPSPDGRYLLVDRVERPYSYRMSWRGFPHVVEVWDLRDGARTVLHEIPMAEDVPIGGVPTGPRMHRWIPIASHTIVWAEALDGGDPKRKAEHRDKWMARPVGGDAEELVRIEQRAWGVSFLDDRRLMITDEYDRDRRWKKTLLHYLDGAEPPVVLEDRSIRDRYGDPGSLVFEATATGHAIVTRHGDWIFRKGGGASADGVFPFLDRQHIDTLETDRIWQCADGSYESVQHAWLDEDELHFITRHETPVSPPNYRRHGPDGAMTTLTEFPDPTPQIRGIHKEVVTYERADGVQLSATLYLPADYQPGTRLPLLVWAYPREFNDPATASQVTRSPHRFTRIASSSHLHLLTQGYAIMDGATMPIIGHPETMNDTFVEQTVMAAKAAIDKAADMGVADPDRVGVGGHSYGAFMTANLLAHSDLFRAGVARSGAYNRTLTPFGFQAERRPLWEAPDIYFEISPFFHADTINEPLLLIHGEIDNNSGTYPIQSKRLFAAIKGNGGKTRLVMLPNESHGYRARESVLHVLAEMIEWFDNHVKYAEPPGGHPEASGS